MLDVNSLRKKSILFSFLDPVTSATFSGDGNCILTSCLDSKIRLFDKENGELLNEYKGHKNTSYKIESCLSNSDSHVVSGDEDGKVFFWELVEVINIYLLSQCL